MERTSPGGSVLRLFAFPACSDGVLQIELIAQMNSSQTAASDATSPSASPALDVKVAAIFEKLGVTLAPYLGNSLEVVSPIDGSRIAALRTETAAGVDELVARAERSFARWKRLPAPHRGEIIRRFGQRVREDRESLALLLSIENGKILVEAHGEVQEVVDICDYAVGLSRQLFGLNMASERVEHRLSEYWHPIGVLGLISAFNFPAAVWAWGTTVALVCGNSAIWKPSEKTPLTAIAFAEILAKVAQDYDPALVNLVQIAVGAAEVGTALVENRSVAIVSATGSVEMGKDVATRVAARFGRSVLELGGNNASIITPSANLELALRASVFAAAGTCGQRCTSLRRLFVHRSCYEPFMQRFVKAVGRLKIGSPLDAETHVGPLIDQEAYDKMQRVLEQALREGGLVHGGGRVQAGPKGGYYVEPAIVEMPCQSAVMLDETFAPIVYVVAYESFSEAIALNNGVSQGLSSSIFTNDVREAEIFQSADGSDCGIVNVNIGTSGAEIGGAFGGEKATGGGRVSGSDSWKNYMRRSTATTNYSALLPLAQGIEFNFEID